MKYFSWGFLVGGIVLGLIGFGLGNDLGHINGQKIGFEKGLNSEINQTASKICSKSGGILEFDKAKFVKCQDDSWHEIMTPLAVKKQ